MTSPQILIDDFPFDVTDVPETEDWQVIDLTNHEFQAYLVEQRRPGLLASWQNDERRKAQAEMLKANRPTMPLARPHVNGMSDEHRANLAKAQLGNTNSKKPHKYPATRKSPTKRVKT